MYSNIPDSLGMDNYFKVMYKLLIVKNRYTKKLDFSTGLNWFKKNTPIEVKIVDEIETDFDVTTEKIGNATYNGVICGDDIYPKLRTVIPEGKYHAVVFVYGNKLDGIRVNVAKELPLYPGTDLIQLCNVKDKGKALNHELFHTFFHRLQRQQVMIEDSMDSVIVNGVVKPYFNNTNLNAKVSNRTIALERLKPYWNMVLNVIYAPQSDLIPIVRLERYLDNGWQTQGKLSVGNFKCYSLEKPWAMNMKNVSCIPKGIYHCKYSFSPKFLKYTYEVLSVPNRSGIRIHSGNFFFDIQGCILLGDSFKDINKDGKVDILNSSKTIKEFEQIMGKKSFNLEIV